MIFFKSDGWKIINMSYQSILQYFVIESVLSAEFVYFVC